MIRVGGHDDIPRIVTAMTLATGREQAAGWIEIDMAAGSLFVIDDGEGDTFEPESVIAVVDVSRAQRTVDVRVIDGRSRRWPEIFYFVIDLIIERGAGAWPLYHPEEGGPLNDLAKRFANTQRVTRHGLPGRRTTALEARAFAETFITRAQAAQYARTGEKPPVLRDGTGGGGNGRPDDRGRP